MSTTATILQVCKEADAILVAAKKRERSLSIEDSPAVPRLHKKTRTEEEDIWTFVTARSEKEFLLPEWLCRLDDAGICHCVEKELSESLVMAYKTSHPALTNRKTFFNRYRRA